MKKRLRKKKDKLLDSLCRACPAKNRCSKSDIDVHGCHINYDEWCEEYDREYQEWVSIINIDEDEPF